jgi:hypothetical protein
MKIGFDEMVEEFQCPGCVCGGDTKCGRYNPDPTSHTCHGHVLGTVMMGLGHIALGLPKGFCRPGRDPFKNVDFNQMNMRFWMESTAPGWDKCNIATWAMEREGFLFVRTYMPRLNYGVLDIICKGNREKLCPTALNVADFYDEID